MALSDKFSSLERLKGLFSTAGRFAVGSGLSLSITGGGPVLLHEFFAVSPETSVAICYAVAVVVNFLVLKFYVYRSDGALLKEALSYLSTSILFRGCEYIGFLALNALGLVPYFVANVVILGISTIGKFVVFKTVVYKSKPVSEPR